MARQVKYGERNDADKAYNARRRYYRAAERNLKKAESESGATAARFRQMALINLENAVATYGENVDPSKVSKPIKELSQKLDYNINLVNTESKLTTRRDKEKLVTRSKNVLESKLEDEETRREQEARALLNNEAIGTRIIGGLVDVWKEKATYTDENGFEKVDNKKIFPAIMEYFGVDSMAAVIDRLEEVIGEDLFATTGRTDNIYEYVKVVIQSHVVDGTLTE